MDLIFRNGKKLYNKSNKIAENVDEFIQLFGEHLEPYQKEILKNKGTELKFYDYNIYGDDFMVSIVAKNIVGECTLCVQDFDENQYLEGEINISFNEDELRQLISLLEIVESKM